jgi:hypothetical protein
VTVANAKLAAAVKAKCSSIARTSNAGTSHSAQRRLNANTAKMDEIQAVAHFADAAQGMAGQQGRLAAARATAVAATARQTRPSIRV